LLWYGFVWIYSVVTLTSVRSLETVRMLGRMMTSLKEANPHNVVTNNSHSLVVAFVLRSFLKLFLRMPPFSGKSTRITTLGISWVHRNLFDQIVWQFVISAVSLHHRALHGPNSLLAQSTFAAPIHSILHVAAFPKDPVASSGIYSPRCIFTQFTHVVVFLYNKSPISISPKC
jgi:hypothetical protein